MSKENTKKRNLTDIIILSLSVVTLIVGIHQTIQNGFANAYWIYMIAVSLLLYHLIRKAKKKQEETQPKLNRRAKRFMERNG